MPTSISLREEDPLLKDLSEKKHSFRRNVMSLATDLKEARTRLAEQQRSCSQEALSRQEAETRAKRMEDELLELTKELNKRNEEILASDFVTEKYTKELSGIKSQLEATQATAEASALSAELTQSQCRLLSKQLLEKTCSLKEHDDRLTRISEELESLQMELQVRESTQKRLRDEVLKIEGKMMRGVSAVRIKDSDEVLNQESPKNLEGINKLLMAKDDEIARLRDELKIISAHWRFKTKELEDQVENQRRIDQELKKKVLKLEFCLRETRIQTRKLQKMGERNDMAIQELKKQFAAKKNHEADPLTNFWDKSGFKIVVSMSMLILVAFSRR